MEQAAVLIGTLPVGPVCARKAGLMLLSRRKTGLVFPVVRRRLAKPQCPQTHDLFEEQEAAI
jgi:hypothetical protein